MDGDRSESEVRDEAWLLAAASKESWIEFRSALRSACLLHTADMHILQPVTYLTLA